MYFQMPLLFDEGKGQAAAAIYPSLTVLAAPRCVTSQNVTQTHEGDVNSALL
jgi:hypothetical protein